MHTTAQPCAQTLFDFREPQCLPDPDSLSDWSDAERQEYAEAFIERPPADKTICPHSSLGYRPPAPEAIQRWSKSARGSLPKENLLKEDAMQMLC